MDELEPTRESALVDLLDRILVKGVVLHADIVISVADIPLIGVNLRAAIAGIKTMLDYGMMEAWDLKIRSYALENEGQGDLDLEEGEELIYKTFASLYAGSAPTPVWKQGYLYLTNLRLILLRKKPRTILLELQLKQLNKVHLMRGMHLGKKRKILILTYRPSLTEEMEIRLLLDGIDELTSKMKDMMPIPAATRTLDR